MSVCHFGCILVIHWSRLNGKYIIWSWVYFNKIHQFCYFWCSVEARDVWVEFVGAYNNVNLHWRCVPDSLPWSRGETIYSSLSVSRSLTGLCCVRDILPWSHWEATSSSLSVSRSVTCVCCVPDSLPWSHGETTSSSLSISCPVTNLSALCSRQLALVTQRDNLFKPLHQLSCH